MSDSQTFVVVGGGLAGAKAVEALRDKGFAGSIVLLAAEDHLPYERPPLSKGYLLTGEGLDEATVHGKDWYDEQRIDLRLATRAASIDRAHHIVSTDTGEQLRYDKLLLATGSSPRHLDLRGADRPGVMYLRTIEDSTALRSAFREGASVVMIGGGWIGLETAAAARQAGAEVTVLESLDLPLVRVLGPRLAGMFASLHREHGVDLRTGVQVAGIHGDDGGPVTAVELADGSVLGADVVVVGVGATPNIELAEDADLDLDNGILVTEAGQTSDPDIFAAGDVANAYRPPLRRRLRVEHWANALNQPAAVAAGMLGEPASYDDLPYFYTDQYDLGMEYFGHGGPDDDVVIRGSLDKRELIAFWLRDGRVTAGMNVNVWDVGDDIKALIAADHDVDPKRLADPSVPLSDLA
jgi:3-phenylpropionate/trans-cinnamate dioxygenase ferredoxin reductase subunit